MGEFQKALESRFEDFFEEIDYLAYEFEVSDADVCTAIGSWAGTLIAEAWRMWKADK